MRYDPGKGEIHAFGRVYRLPEGRVARLVLGSLLILFGFLGFLPVLGFWMIPLGLIVLSQDLPRVRRWRRRIAVAWGRKRAPNGRNGNSANG